MQSFQARLFESFERIAAVHKCVLVQQPFLDNTGQLLALRVDATTRRPDLPWQGRRAEPFDVVARLRYVIMSSCGKVSFNGAQQRSLWLSGPAPADAETRVSAAGETLWRNPDVFYFEPHEADRINAMFARWDELLP